MLKILFRWIFGEPCNHDWEVISSQKHSKILSSVIAGRWWEDDTQNILLKCKKCGKLTTRKI